MNAITSNEAGRITSILNEAIGKINICNFIPVHPNIELTDRIEGDGDIELSDLFYKQWQLEEAMLSTASTIGMINELKGKTYENTRSLVRQLQSNPIAMENLQYTMGEIGELEKAQVNFTTLVSSLQDKYSRLVNTSLEDEKHNTELLKDITERAAKATEHKNILNTKLLKLRQARDIEVGDLEKITKQLREELADIQKSTHNTDSLLTREFEEESSKILTKYDAQANYLQQEITKYEIETSETNTNNKIIERTLRKNKNKSQIELQNLIEIYDTQMLEKQESIAKIKSIHGSEQVELVALVKYFKKIDDELERIAIEDKIIAEEKAKVAAAKKIIDDAATEVQKIWKGHMQRREYAKMKKKAKKGKGKKKK